MNACDARVVVKDWTPAFGGQQGHAATAVLSDLSVGQHYFISRDLCQTGMKVGGLVLVARLLVRTPLYKRCKATR